MNGSLPPISRLTLATRSAQSAAIFFPVSTEPVKATQSMRSSATIAAPTSPAPASRLTTPSRQVVEARRERQGRERGQLGRLADRRVAGGERRRQLPGEQQQRVVPGHDAADGADRVLDHQRQLAGLDRGDHPPGGVAADLGVVVERRRGPADLVGVLDQRLSALERHQLGELVAFAPAGAVRPRAASRRAPPRASAPSRAARRAAAAIAASTWAAVGKPDRRDGLLGERVLDRERLAGTGDELAADLEARLDLGHGPMLDPHRQRFETSAPG